MALLNLTIPAGESLSNAVDLLNNQPYIIFMPDEWTPANLTFEIASGTGAFYRMFFSGKEWERAGTPNAALMLDVASIWPKGLKVKIRSGTSDKPVIQNATRVLQLLAG